MSWKELLVAAEEIRAAAVIADPSLGDLPLAGLGWATVEVERAFIELDLLFASPGADAGAAGSWAPVDRDPALGARAWVRGTAGSPDGPWLVVLEPDTEGRVAAALARFGEGVAAIYLGNGPVRQGRLVRGGPAWGPHVVILGAARRACRRRGPTLGPSVTELAFPVLRLRRAEGLLDLPWELPLGEWPDSLAFRELDVGPSRHLVRFLVVDGALVALKELPIEVARREYAVLGHLERVGLPAVLPIGIAEHATLGNAILVTEYLAHSLQFRRLLARFPLGPGPYRTRLLDAMAWLLIDLHRGGVFWGDCSLANTLFRRDGDRIQAFLVDAETSETHPELSEGQRAFDLEILVENVGYGLADVAALQGRPEDFDDAVDAAEAVRERYRAIWNELHLEPALPAGDRHAIRSRLRHLNELGFAVDEIEVIPQEAGSEVRLRVTTSNREFHAHELERMTGVVALEGQARLLLNDLREHATWLALSTGEPVPEDEGAMRWRREVFEPAIRRLTPAIGQRDPLQAYCDVLEHKWLLSEREGRDVGLERAIAAYLEVGAPAPEPPTL